MICTYAEITEIFETLIRISEFDKKIPSRSEYIKNMFTKFPESGKFPRIGIHILSRDTTV